MQKNRIKTRNMVGFNYPASKINAKQITKTLIFVQFCGRPPRRGAWIETPVSKPLGSVSARRPPRRGAWIETAADIKAFLVHEVAPRAGGRGLKHPAMQ